MELFSVACITCRAKIKVQSMSAIGQVLACPRCGGMVEITPPPGWKPPTVAKPEAAKAALPRAQPTAKGQATVPAAAAVSNPSTDYVGIAEPVLDDDPLAEAMRVAAERERAQRKLLKIGGACAGVALVAAGIWFGLSKPADEHIAEKSNIPDAPPTAIPTATLPVPKTSATPDPKPIPSATPTATPIAPPNPLPAASPTATAASAVIARVEPRMAPPVPSSSAPPIPPIPPASPNVIGPRPTLAPPSPEVEARLAAKAPTLDFTGATRKSALEIVGRLAGVDVQFDWDTLAAIDLKLAERITLKLRDVTYAEALTKLLDAKIIDVRVVGGSVVVGRWKQGPWLEGIEYPIGNLTNGDAAQAEMLAALVRTFVEPAAWSSRGGPATIKSTPDKLTVSGLAEQASTSLFDASIAWLDRLKLARGVSPVGSANTPPQSLESRAAWAKKSLEKLAVMNFRPGVPLAEVLAHLEKSCDVVLTVDYAALAERGFLAQEPIGIAADKKPLGLILSALCDPRDWAWRIIDDKTFEITAREALRRRPYTELYDLKTLTAAGVAPIVLIEQLKTQFADAGWAESGGEGVAYYDKPSGRLLIRQHQEAQLRIERFLTELAAAALAGESPAATPAATGAKPSGTASPKGTNASPPSATMRSAVPGTAP